MTLDWRAEKGKIGGKTCGTGKGNKPAPCTGSFGVVQRAFSSSSSASGPIEIAQLWEAGGYGVNSFRQCDSGNSLCTRSLGREDRGARNARERAVGRRSALPHARARPEQPDAGAGLRREPLEPRGRVRASAATSPDYVINTGQSCAGYNNPGAMPDPVAVRGHPDRRVAVAGRQGHEPPDPGRPQAVGLHQPQQVVGLPEVRPRRPAHRLHHPDAVRVVHGQRQPGVPGRGVRGLLRDRVAGQPGLRQPVPGQRRRPR